MHPNALTGRGPSDSRNFFAEIASESKEKIHEKKNNKKYVILTPHNSLNDKGAEKKEICIQTPVRRW